MQLKTSKNISTTIYTEDGQMVGAMNAITSETQPLPSLSLNISNQELYKANEADVKKAYVAFKKEYEEI